MTSSPAPLRVALIGHGYVGRTFHAPLIRATPGLELALIGSRDADAVRAAAAQAGCPGVAVEADYLAAAQAPRHRPGRDRHAQ